MHSKTLDIIETRFSDLLSAFKSGVIDARLIPEQRQPGAGRFHLSADAVANGNVTEAAKILRLSLAY